jgi:GrpB-like predicted nucleotidyltransferase (UPF0157 family)
MEHKKLAELSLGELWQLFPIILTAHQDCWADWYKEETELLKEKLSYVERISHIGSTAIKEIWAKPIIDILVEISKEEKLSNVKGIIERCGYICMAENNSRINFNKGYTLQGFAERVFHLHLRYEGDNDELYFRDYLQANADVAKEYECLKFALWKQYEHDRDMYTFHKGDFIKQCTQKGKLLFIDKYDNKRFL